MQNRPEIPSLTSSYASRDLLSAPPEAPPVPVSGPLRQPSFGPPSLTPAAEESRFAHPYGRISPANGFDSSVGLLLYPFMFGLLLRWAMRWRYL